MVNLFRPKTMRRMAVFAALIAPIVYLFGVSFAGLAGAHGDSPFDSDTKTVLYQKDIVYSQLFRRNSFSNTSNGVTVSGVNGNYSVSGDPTTAAHFNIGSTLITGGHVYCLTVFADGPSMASATWQVWISNSSLSYIRYYISTYIVFTLDSDDAVDVRVAAYSGAIDATFSINIFDLSVMYPDSPTYESLSNDFDVVDALPFAISSNVVVPVYGVPDGSQYWFNQFFPKDNFLAQWGENAISENPFGFAPFGYFWRYLDTNVLHLSNEQVGLMAYGYMYYAAHVLLFDVGFMLVTFFLSFIQKVGDKIGGEER